MRFDLEGLDVFFPYEKIYYEQYDYMLNLKRAIDAKGHALLEMPTGTGKTVCLVALVTSYQFQYPQTGKLIYCTRTVQEMYKTMDEIRRVIAYRESAVGPEGGKILALCLSSRKNMCIHQRVEEGVDREAVDSICRSMTASWVRAKAGVKVDKDRNARIRNNGGTSSSTGNNRNSSSSNNNSDSSSSSRNTGGAAVNDIEDIELCGFYEKYENESSAAEVPGGVYSLDDLKQLGRDKGWCPYFTARHMLNRANVVVYNYQYMLDPKVANLVSKELEQESIVVFDEAHNIDNVCIEAFSIVLDRRKIEASMRGVHRLNAKISEVVQKKKANFQNDYNNLVNGLIAEGTWLPADQVRGQPVLTEDQLQEAVPGSIRKNEHFVAFLKKLVVYFKTLMEGPTVEVQTALSFLRGMNSGQIVDRKAMRFTLSRLNALMRLLEIAKLEEFQALMDVATFTTLLATYTEEGFNVVFEPQGSMVAGINEPLLQLCCLDASIAIKPVFDRFQSVIITSGTLSPIGDYAKLLNFEPVIKQSFEMKTFRRCLLPLIVTRGRDQVAISSRYESRKDDAVVRNFGELLIDVSSTVPDGVCAFFTSYSYMEYVLAKWDEWGIIERIWQHKLVFMETKDVLETQEALANFKRSCDCGRGAVFLSIARGKVAEGVDFDRHYGRCVLLFGIPIQYTQSYVLRARMAFMLEKYQIREQDFLIFDALRQAAQCVGRVIRSKEDYGIVILADYRYNKQDKRSKLPQWVNQFIRDSSLNVSTDIAIDRIKAYLKEMGQPIDRLALDNIVMTEEQIRDKNSKRSAYKIAASASEREKLAQQSRVLRPDFHARLEAEAEAKEKEKKEKEKGEREEGEMDIEDEEVVGLDNDLPEGSVIASRSINKDLLRSINAASVSKLDGTNVTGAKRSLEKADIEAPALKSTHLSMFLDLDSDED